MVASGKVSQDTELLLLNMWRTSDFWWQEEHSLMELSIDGLSKTMERRLDDSVSAHDQVRDVSTSFGCDPAGAITGASTFTMRAFNADGEMDRCFIWSTVVGGVDVVGANATIFPGNELTAPETLNLDDCGELIESMP